MIHPNGLQPKGDDTRDFKLGNIINLPKLTDLPPELVIGLPEVVDQQNTDFCAAASSGVVREIQEGVPLSYEWLFAAAKSMAGQDINSYGLNLRDVCKAHVTFGCIERSEAPYSLETNSPDFLRNIKNWPPELFIKAQKHKAGSFFAVTGPYDHYDNLRATMYYFRNEKCGVVFGVVWSWLLTQVDITTVSQNGSGHALAQVGYTPEGIYVQNSVGVNAGKDGRHYFSREVINAFVDVYGAFMFHDMPKDTAKWYHDNEIKLTDSWVIQFIKIVIKYFK